jgi:hypothetical protein
LRAAEIVSDVVVVIIVIVWSRFCSGLKELLKEMARFRVLDFGFVLVIV